jgi:hypothetical protein
MEDDMKPHLSVAFLVALALPATASPVIEMTLSCSAENSVSHHEPFCSASAQAPGNSERPWALANAYAEVTAQATDQDYGMSGYMYGAWVSASAIAFANGYLSAAADSSVTLTRWLSTGKPVRPGWVDLWADFDVDWTGSASGGWELRVGEFNMGPFCTDCNGLFPFTLGEPFEVYLSSTASAAMFGREYPDYGNSSVRSLEVRFSFYEADRVTPAFAFDIAAPVSIPEPVGTGGAGVLVLVLLRLIRRN